MLVSGGGGPAETLDGRADLWQRSRKRAITPSGPLALLRLMRPVALLPLEPTQFSSAFTPFAPVLEMAEEGKEQVQLEPPRVR
ncbi:hypothetical protein AB0D14_40370 [Streptomyces sp. NPDC048484]|uniref:hypothetical protein n=1 Tax=Streptomyces sp. NPDC048484 TaxID=3155146 RepID=UPI0034320EB9